MDKERGAFVTVCPRCGSKMKNKKCTSCGFKFNIYLNKNKYNSFARGLKTFKWEGTTTFVKLGVLMIGLYFLGMLIITFSSLVKRIIQ